MRSSLDTTLGQRTELIEEGTSDLDHRFALFATCVYGITALLRQIKFDRQVPFKRQRDAAREGWIH